MFWLLQNEVQKGKIKEIGNRENRKISNKSIIKSLKIKKRSEIFQRKNHHALLLENFMNKVIKYSKIFGNFICIFNKAKIKTR